MRAQSVLEVLGQDTWRRWHLSQASGTHGFCLSPVFSSAPLVSPTRAGNSSINFIDKSRCFAQNLVLPRCVDKVLKGGDGVRAFQVKITT